MSISNERIAYLWQQFAEKKASENELAELFSLLNEASQVEGSRLYLQELMANSPAIEILDKRKWEPVLNSILRKQTTVPARGLFIQRLWWAAAAALILAAGCYFLFFNKQPKEIAQTKTEIKNDIVPGGNNAILTLGNGQQIILDSAHIGTLAQQGNSKIIKTDSGKLSYTPSGGTGSEAVYNVLSTPNGGQYQLTLPDGTRVWLNAASSIKYPVAFAGKERTVEITGEAYFEVVHNGKQPFKVKAGNQTTEDIGTSFNVNAYADENAITTTLIEGAAKANGFLLHPGEQASTPVSGATMINKNINTEDVTAWKNGRFRFNGADIESIMRQAGRWYDVQVQYQGKVNETFSGGISRNVNASELFHILEITGKVHFEINGKTIIVKPK